MFAGLFFKAKALRILKEEFACTPIKAQIPVFSEIVREARRTHANEYEAAIFFMLAQLNVLIPDAANRKVVEFVERHSKKAAQLTRRFTASSAAVLDLLNGIRARHGLVPLMA